MIDCLSARLENRKMPIKSLFVPTDLARARQILSSWASFKELSSDQADIISRMIAQGIAEGRNHGLELAEADAASARQ
jgi:hypothetical protein